MDAAKAMDPEQLNAIVSDELFLEYAFLMWAW